MSAQALFFVGTAPLQPDGHLNISPKGPIGSLRVIDAHTVAYLDVVGSGAETIAHLRENGRIVIMLCAFSGPPRIVRLHGHGRVHLPGSDRFAELMATCAFVDPALPEARRALIEVTIARVSDSCGYGVPRMNFEAERTQARAWCERKLAESPDALRDYQRKKNAYSIDGLPALELEPKPPAHE